MKQYIKYIILFIILIFVGIVGVNLYNNKNFQDSTKTTPKVTSKEKNNTNSYSYCYFYNNCNSLRKIKPKQ